MTSEEENHTTIINDRFCLFKTHDRDILFDIQSNLIYSVGLEQGGNSDKLINALNREDTCFNSQAIGLAKHQDGSNFALNINLTPICNLKCIYCFAQGGNYGNMVKPMDEDIIGQIDELVKNYKTSSNKVRLEFFGGEPLLNFNVIKTILSFTRNYSTKENMKFINRISTNLTHVNEEIIQTLGENNFIISVSIDGCREVQDSLRPFKNDKGSFDVIMNNVKSIREKFDNVIIVARITIAQKGISLLENIKALISTDYFDYVSIYPASIKDEKHPQKKYKYYFDEEIKQQINEVICNYDHLFDISKRFRGILEYEKIYDALLNGKISVSHCAAGATYFTLSGDKSVVPCHRLCGKDNFILNQDTSVLDRKIINDWSVKVDDHPECSKCWARYICGGGCKQEHYSANGTIHEVNKDSCKYHKFVLENLIVNLVKFPEAFNKRKIDVEDLFVYCGRPVVGNLRKLPKEQLPEETKVFANL